ncbi:MAG: carboxypeptidase regulatory-like domain-containing protein [Phycisphaerae bacterium]|nr:carboxypeptidase regulatory-like domain-containing protein [Phycisphaerae bacterium]
MKPSCLNVIATALLFALGSVSADAAYRTYAEIEQLLEDAENDYPEICQRHDLGLSYQGRRLWALNITNNPGVEEDEPEFKYVSTMHGDEWTCNEMCLYLIDHMLSNYGSDSRITNLIDEIDIWIVPLMNPDGYVANTRSNAQGIDLNRNFPEWVNGDPNTTSGRATETAVVMDWTFASSFTLSANFHTGALVVNYPFDNDGMGSVPSPSPDDDLFIYISEQYSQHNQPMWDSPSFYHGITNGADWYSIDGGMQDWHYRYMGDNEVTIEFSNNKRPPSSEIPQFWEENRESMLSYMDTCLIGIRGIVTDANSGAPLLATVTVAGRDHEIYSDPDVGDYHRMLLPGTYDLTFEVDGYEPVTIQDVVVTTGEATRLDVQLSGPVVVTYPNGGETLTTGVPIEVTWAGNPVAQFHVQYTANYDDYTNVTDDFENAELGPEYTFGGDADWYASTEDAHGGARSAQAGDIGDYDTTWMTRTVPAGELSFWYRVSSENGWDWFDFYIDGVRKIHASGQGSWALYTTTLVGSSHELKWEYTKDTSMSYYSDTAWIDDLEITCENTVWTDIIALTAPGATSTPWAPPAAGSDYKVRVRSYISGGYGVFNESAGTFTVADPSADGDFDGDSDVDLEDFAAFQACLGDSPSAPCAAAFDFEPDGDVDLVDFNILSPLLVGPGG